MYEFRGKKDFVSIEQFTMAHHVHSAEHLIPHNDGTYRKKPAWRPPTVEEVEGDDTPVLTTEDFWTKAMTRDKIGPKTEGKLPYFIKFFGPDCEECDTFAPIWKEFHNRMTLTMNVVNIDCGDEASKEICDQMVITKYPTLIYMRLNQAYIY